MFWRYVIVYNVYTWIKNMILGEKIKQMYELTYKHIFISQGILIHTPLIHSPIKNGFEKEHCFAACIVSQSNSGIGILQLS